MNLCAQTRAVRNKLGSDRWSCWSPWSAWRRPRPTSAASSSCAALSYYRKALVVVLQRLVICNIATASFRHNSFCVCGILRSTFVLFRLRQPGHAPCHRHILFGLESHHWFEIVWPSLASRHLTRVVARSRHLCPAHAWPQQGATASSAT